MPLAPVNDSTVPDRAETTKQVVAAYLTHQRRTGRGNVSFTQAARVFMRRWPHPQDWADEALQVQLAAGCATRPFITFLLVTGRLHPGWDYMVNRKFSSLWRDVPNTAIGVDLEAFIDAATGCGYSERVASAMASQVMARVLFATGRPLSQTTHADFDDLTAAGIRRQQSTGRTWKHYRGTATATRAGQAFPVRAFRWPTLGRHHAGWTFQDECSTAGPSSRYPRAVYRAPVGH